MATFDEANHCPKCNEPGEVGSKRPSAKPGVSAIVCTCRNKRCKWFNTGWVIQINPNGTVPEARDRSQSDREPRQYERVNSVLFNQRSRAMQEIASQAARQTGQGGEAHGQAQ
jgi:hypothetical protein